MADKITNYQCPKCTGPLHFSSETGKLECEYCGSSFDPAEIESLYAAKNEKAEEAFAADQAEVKKEETADKNDAAADGTQEESAWDTSELKDDWGEDSAKLKSYNCPSCGAELICDETTAATSCPYCGNPTVVPGQFKGTLKPDTIIPFKLDKDAAVAALKKHYKGKLLLPGSFTASNHVQEIKGLYVPFWLFDAKTDANCVFEATNSEHFTDGEYKVTKTNYFEAIREGTVSFEKIPADGSKKMKNDYMDSIEPYDYSELKPFSMAYLPGYLADKYDVTAKGNAKRVEKRCIESASEMMRRDVVGYENVIAKSEHVYLERGKVSYALLPVWTLVTKWNGKNYLFMMNGQTGKMVGDLPVDKQKLAVAFALFALAAIGLFQWVGFGQWIASIFIS